MAPEPIRPAGVAAVLDVSAATAGGRYRARIRGTLTFFWLAIVWELGARYVVRDERMLAPFSEVVRALIKLFVSGEIWKHLSVSANVVQSSSGRTTPATDPGQSPRAPSPAVRSTTWKAMALATSQ